MCLPRRRRLKRRGHAQDERVHHTVVSRTLPTRPNLTRCLACQRSYQDCSKPALRGASERLGKTQGHIRTYATLPLQDAMQGRGRGIERDCEFPGTEPVGPQIDRGEKSPGCGGLCAAIGDSPPSPRRRRDPFNHTDQRPRSAPCRGCSRNPGTSISWSVCAVSRAARGVRSRLACCGGIPATLP